MKRPPITVTKRLIEDSLLIAAFFLSSSFVGTDEVVVVLVDEMGVVMVVPVDEARVFE